MKKMKKNYHCPRCWGAIILDCNHHIKCIDCNLEFNKRDLKIFDEDIILAQSEKEGILRVLQEQYNKKTISDIFHGSYSI
ncbi:MAG: hypothetical protein ACTSR7_19520 [Promethearchaeota archaeon]